MNDASLQRWSEVLGELRAERENAINEKIKEKAASFAPAEFFELGTASLEAGIEKWIALEQESWGNTVPPAAEVHRIKTEMEAVIDFELDALAGDAENIRSQITWDDGEFATAEGDFKTNLDELRKKFQLKLNNAVGAGRKKSAVASEPAPAPVHAGYSRGTASPVASLGMFVLGLALGVAPSIYFWDSVKRAERRFEDERARQSAEHKTLMGNMTLVQDLYEKLAMGRMKNIPSLNRDLEMRRQELEKKKEEVEARFTRERDKVLKKTPAGVRQDDALEDLEEDRKKRLADIEQDFAASVENLKKQKETLEDLLVH